MPNINFYHEDIYTKNDKCCIYYFDVTNGYENELLNYFYHIMNDSKRFDIIFIPFKTKFIRAIRIVYFYKNIEIMPDKLTINIINIIKSIYNLKKLNLNYIKPTIYKNKLNRDLTIMNNQNNYLIYNMYKK